jgi:tetratricopeptide (TPR) repeat protein
MESNPSGDKRMSRYEGLALSDDLSAEAIQAEVERILGSEKFSRSARLRSLLKFTVAQTLQGNANVLKEYVIGTEVLRKPESYDPRSDSLVRVLASRLRVKLKQYYANGGSEDPLVINFPKGGYVPVFQRREKIRAEAEKKLAARNLYSRARFRASELTPDALADSATALRESIAADPEWPVPHVALAGIHAFQGFLGFCRPREVWPAAKAAAETALQHDEMSSEAHLYLGLTQAFYEWNWHDAAIHLDKAIERDSYSGGAYLWRALAYGIPTGRRSKAEDDIQRAGELAPTPFLEEAHALALYLTGQHETLLRRTGNLEDKGRSANWLGWLRGLSFDAIGEPAAALKILERMAETNPSEPKLAAALGCVLAEAGQHDRARAILASLKERKAASYDQAVVHAALGNSNDAILHLQESLKEREPWALYLNADPRLASLKPANQFVSLVRRIGPEQQSASA